MATDDDEERGEDESLYPLKKGFVLPPGYFHLPGILYRRWPDAIDTLIPSKWGRLRVTDSLPRDAGEELAGDACAD